MPCSPSPSTTGSAPRWRAGCDAAGQLSLGTGQALTPREIQARLRAGEPAQEIARRSGVPLERVERWEGPVAAERAHVLDLALATPVGESGAPLADAVASHLVEVGADPEVVVWTAVREPDADWEVRASRPGRTGRWSFRPSARRLHPLDGGAAALLEDAPPPPTPIRRAPDPRTAAPVRGPVQTTVPVPGVDDAGTDGAPGDDEHDDAPRPTLPGWDDIVAGSRSRRSRSALDHLLDGDR